jgi:VWFA-related protein
MHALRPIVIFASSFLLIPAPVISGPSCAAQTPVVPAPQSVPAENAPANAANAGAIVLHENANLVLVDVVVTNRDKAVHGLGRQRFHLFEDGHEQVITSFDEHRAPDPGTMPLMKRLYLPPHTFTNIPDYPEAGAVNVLLLDGLNTPFTDQMNVRLRMIQYIGKIKPGTSLAIFGLSSRLRMIAGFSTDLAALTAALKNPKAAAQQSTTLDTEAAAQQAGATAAGQSEMTTPVAPGLNPPAPVSDAAGNNGPMGIVAAAQVFQADIASFQADQRAAMTLEAMQQLARYLSAIPGRKNVIWFSGSFPSWTPPDNSLGLGAFRAVSGRMEQVRETTKILSDARISIYPVDARGLMVSSLFSAANNHPPVGGAFATALHNERDETIREQATMQQIAQDTGGKAFLDTNDFANAVSEVVENGSSYYTIGYVPSRKAFDGKFHTFKVHLDDASCKLAFRSGYYADSPDQPSIHHPGEGNLVLAASGHGAPLATQISFVARVLPANDPLLQGAVLTKGPIGSLAATVKVPVHRYVVDLVLDLHGFVLDTTTDGKHVANIELALVAYDDEGTRLNYLEHGFQMAMTADRYPKLMTTGVPIRAEFDLPEGQGSLRIAIHDLCGGRAGSLEVPVKVTSNQGNIPIESKEPSLRPRGTLFP